MNEIIHDDFLKKKVIMINVVKKYLEKSQYANQTADFEDLFLSHPNYPSVFAITDSLNMLSVENIAIKIPKEQFVELPDFFLAIFRRDLVLVSKNENSISIETEAGKKEKLTFDEFLTDWDEIIIAVEPNNAIIAKNETASVKWMLYSLPIIAIIIMSLLYNNYNLNTIVLLLTSLTGLFISVFIVREELGLKNEIVSKFCNANSNTSCSSVINSGKSAITKWMHFSDLPLLFFSISTLSLLLQPKDSGLIVGLLCLLSIPVILYSFWLQKFSLKKWCVLCLAVSFVVILQAFLFGFANETVSDILSVNFYGFLFSFLLCTFVWLFGKPILQGKIKAEKDVLDLKKLKRNYSVFNSLTKEIPVLSGFDQLEGLSFGNKEADAQLTIIISPSCGHCHKAFEEAFEMVSKFPKKMFLNVLFNINPDNEKNPYRIVAESLLAIDKLIPEKTEEAIIDWHIKKMELETWKKKWIVEFIDMKTTHQLYQQYDWCLENGFNYTPVKIINNKQFPNEYEISDLKYFLNDFSEEKRAMENIILIQA
ncbi:hypothetical protein FLJC2902T_01670 [Flavobacterium limnosediminis JC2902]|uniref:Vitamin K epoxide reductase domain-containing protein n=2 Tax=Flavobacterium TaxID=237 RepID=V6STC1_9FLAO|nr:hypothetical protein FLJC2902T_01670 [Flavobacterium limnosediminis JC2902]